MILQIFFTKMAITQARKVQIAKFLCLESSTNIWLSCGNIYSIPKINKIEIEGKKGSKLAKIGQFFALKKLKLHFLKNFPRLFDSFFLWLPIHQTYNISLTKFMEQDSCGGRDAWVAWNVINVIFLNWGKAHSTLDAYS